MVEAGRQALDEFCGLVRDRRACDGNATSRSAANCINPACDTLQSSDVRLTETVPSRYNSKASSFATSRDAEAGE